jgi:hypothetical protein
LNRRFRPDKGDIALIVIDFQDGVLAAVGELSDAVCSRRKSDWEVSLRMVEQAGGVVTSTEIIAFQLLQRAGTAEFKVMSSLIGDALYES